MTDVFSLAPPLPNVLFDPLRVAPSTNGERFDLSYEASQATARSFPAERNYRLEFDRAAEAFRQAGVVLENPYTDLASPYSSGVGRVLVGGTSPDVQAERDRRLRAWDDAAQRLQDQNPDALDTFPNAASLRLNADGRARQAARDANAVDDAAGWFGPGWMGGVAGMIVGTMQDPVQALTLTLGAPWRAVTGGASLLAQIGRTAAFEGAIGAGTQALIETSAAPYRQRLGVEGDALGSILGAAIGGALIGGGLRGVVGAFELRGVRARAEGGAATPADIAANDALNLTQIRLMELAGNPAGPEGVRAHEAALDQATGDIARGRSTATRLAAQPEPSAEAMILMGLDLPARQARIAETVTRVVDTQGSAPGGAWRDDIGAITIDWGTPGNANRDFRGGFGLSHIIAHRDAQGLDGAAFVRDVLPEVLTYGTQGRLYQRGESWRLDLEWQGNRVVLRLDRDGTRENWVLTGLPLDRDGPGGTGGVRPAPPYASASSDIRTPEGAGPPAGTLAPGARRIKVYTPVGRAVLVEPQLVELDQLVPSHLDDGAQNPAYPHAEGVQPRDRGAAPSRDQVRAIAAGLIPERLEPNREAGFGAPIVADDLVVESGNGRVMALRFVYGDPALREVAEVYRASLIAQGHDVTGMRNPVLVSRRITALSPEERRAFVAEANGRATLAQGVGERARADAGKLEEALPLWRGGDVDSAANAPFARAFLARLTPEERGALITKDGRLSAEGAGRLRAALLARAYGDEAGPLLDRLLEGDTDGIKAVTGALTDVSARWAQLRQAVAAGEVDAGMDATADLIGALRMMDEARRLEMPVAQLLMQGDLDRAPLTDVGRAFLAGFYGQGERLAARPTIAARLEGFVTEAMKARPGPNLFGAAPVRAAEILDGTRLREPAEPLSNTYELPPGDAGPALRLDFTEEAADIFAARQRAILRAAEDQAETRPPVERLASAEVLEAQRVAAARDLAVPDGDLLAEGEALGMRGARDLLEDADQGIADAGQAAMCLIGGAA